MPDRDKAISMTRGNMLPYALGWTLLFNLYLLFFFLGSGLDRSETFSGPFWLIVLVCGLALAAFWLGAFILNAMRRRIWHLAVLFVAPAIALFVVAAVNTMNITSERLQLELNRRAYDAELAGAAQLGVPRFHTFPWGNIGGGPTSASYNYTLVFDETDEIGLPPSQRSTGWQERTRATICPEPPPCALFESAGRRTVTVQKISGHYYLVTTMSQ
jgi:hypothetical protein